jgi:pyrroloquinoline-quinone synthase
VLNGILRPTRSEEEQTLNATAWDRIEAARERWNVLRHPFYTRWSAGELSAGELAAYTGQYRRAVEAIAAMSETVGEAFPDRPELARHAEVERDHVGLWDDFLDAAGGSRDADPTPETAACTESWTVAGDPLATLARLYAIESSQPAIARTKLEGLTEHYGFEEGPATEYFALHEVLDVEHAREGRELIAELAGEGRDEELVAAATAAFRANWRLLDGV